MNLKLNYEGLEKYLVDRQYSICPIGIHYLFKFDNGLGASVIKTEGCSHGYSDDLWELAIIQWWHPYEYHLVYMNEITWDDNDNDDVYGYLTDKEVRDFLNKIKELKVTL